MFAGQMFRHPHFALEDISVVVRGSVYHLHRPNTIDRTSDQTVERFVGMVVLRASGDIGGVEDYLLQIVQFLYSTGIIIDSITGIYQTSIGRGILIPFSGIVRPTIVPPHTGWVYDGVTSVVVIIDKDVRITHPGFYMWPVIIIDIIHIPCGPPLMRSVNGC